MAVQVVSGGLRTIATGGHVVCRSIGASTPNRILVATTRNDGTFAEVYRAAGSTNASFGIISAATVSPSVGSSRVRGLAHCQGAAGIIWDTWIEHDAGSFPSSYVNLYISQYDPGGSLIFFVPVAISINVNTSGYYTDCAYDPTNNVVHVVFSNAVTLRLGQSRAVISYCTFDINTNTWGTILFPNGTTEISNYPSVIFSKFLKLPVISYRHHVAVTDSAAKAAVALADAGVPTAWTVKDIAISSINIAATFNGPSLVEDYNGDLSVAWVGNHNQSSAGENTHELSYCRHQANDSFSTWSSPILVDDADTYKQATVHSRGYGGQVGDQNILAVGDQASDLVERAHNYNTFNGIGKDFYTFSSPALSLGAPFVKARWGSFNEPALHVLDYAYGSSGNVFFDSKYLNIPIC